MNAPLNHAALDDPALALPAHADVVVIGAGFSGLGAAIALKKAGREDFVVLEKGGEVGGTWRDNTYPGCACDVPSHLYSYSFEQNPGWSRMFSSQPEIWDYLRGVADRYGLRRHIRHGRTLTRAAFDAEAGLWRLGCADGAAMTARVVICGMGILSRPAKPHIPGLDSFAGVSFHSAEWRHDYDLTGKTVAVIGTGASAIQFIPQIAPQVKAMQVFQRTPPWVAPKLDRPIKAWEKALFRAVPAAQGLFRRAIYCMLETRALGFNLNPAILKRAQSLVIRHMEQQIPDPELRARLTPDYTLGCKRVLISNDYFPALMRDNVTLETGPIARISERGVVTTDGREHAVDVIIFGTGFAVTDALSPTEVTGLDGRSLNAEWSDAPEAYLGLTVSGYPNLFFLLGPNTGLGHNSVVYMIESQIRYVMDALRLLDRTGARFMDVKAEVQSRFNAVLQQRIAKTVWSAGGCKSWYKTEAGKNFTIWPGFTFEYRSRTRKVAPADYGLERAGA